MNKKGFILTVVLACSMIATTAFASPGGKDGGNGNHSGKPSISANSDKGNNGNKGNDHNDNGKKDDDHKNDKNSKDGNKNGNDNGKGGSKESVTDAVYGGKPGKTTVTSSVYGNKGKTVTGSVYGKGNTVTGSVYGHGHNGAHGLLNAYGNVKDKPAGERIASLLKSKYGIDVTIEENTDLSALAQSLAANGNSEAAAYVQGMADVLTNPANLDGYKKLGKLNKKRGNKDIGTFVNGEELQFDVAPVIEAGHTLVPFRAIAEALDAEVSWDPASSTVTVTRDGVEIKIVLGSIVATVNGTTVKIEYPGKMKDNRVMVPLRFLSEAFQADVQWEPESRCVIILDSNTSAAASTNA